MADYPKIEKEFSWLSKGDNLRSAMSVLILSLLVLGGLSYPESAYPQSRTTGGEPSNNFELTT